MRLLITGASGYVGAAILRRAPKAWTVAATCFTQTIARERVAVFCLDVRDAAAVQRAVSAFRPEAIIHTAALMTGEAMFAVNVAGTRHVARAATQCGARLVHLSTDVIFDGENPPYTEAALPTPIFPYGESKAQAERVARAECPTALIVRTSLVYGFAPLDPRTRQVLAGEMPRLFTDEFRCPICVDDLADALLELAPLAGRVATLNVAGTQRLSRYDFGVALARAFGSAPKFQPALSATHPARRPRDCTLDVTRAQNLLRVKLRGVDHVLADRGR